MPFKGSGENGAFIYDAPDFKFLDCRYILNQTGTKTLSFYPDEALPPFLSFDSENGYLSV